MHLLCLICPKRGRVETPLAAHLERSGQITHPGKMLHRPNRHAHLVGNLLRSQNVTHGATSAGVMVSGSQA